MQDFNYNDFTKRISSIEFTILGNEEIRRMSALMDKIVNDIYTVNEGITNTELYENNEPKKGGLIDTRMGKIGRAHV